MICIEKHGCRNFGALAGISYSRYDSLTLKVIAPEMLMI
jgi:hypothetical protein